VHYTTRFLDGLKPAVRVLVAIQQPPDLDTAYSLALLYEELGDGVTPLNTTPVTAVSSRRAQAAPFPVSLPIPPAKWVSRSVEEKKLQEQSRQSPEDKWAHLKAYRRSKGLCFVCGEKWSREHQCKQSIQLHVVQEMVEYLQDPDDSDTEGPEGEQVTTQPVQHLMAMSAAAQNTTVQAPRTMQLLVQIQGQQFLFLVDSGSSSCFLDAGKAALLTGLEPLPHPIPVKVAGGAVLQCTHHFPLLTWTADGASFQDTFKVLELGSYDGIIGLDWLSKYSPMVTHWEQGWLAIQHEGWQVVLQGDSVAY
jgi:hypothetical protein